MQIKRMLSNPSRGLLRRTQDLIYAWLGAKGHARTERELATLLGVSPQTLLRILDPACDYQLHANLIYRAADVFEVDLSWLMTGHGSKQRLPKMDRVVW
ncbi:MAG: hypothetical protein IKQ04_03875 [Oscillospiraceae bacterium]|nr:hypothetical protein [Oscillospiraceae bacterium]